MTVIVRNVVINSFGENNENTILKIPQNTLFHGTFILGHFCVVFNINFNFEARDDD